MGLSAPQRGMFFALLQMSRQFLPVHLSGRLLRGRGVGPHVEGVGAPTSGVYSRLSSYVSFRFLCSTREPFRPVWFVLDYLLSLLVCPFHECPFGST